MKHILFLLLPLLAISARVGAQAPDSTAWRYAEIKVPLGGFTSKTKVEVNYGENVTSWVKGPERIEDEAGRPIKFKSAVDALNHMSRLGWELVQSYHSEDDLGVAKLHYQNFIMRRREAVAK
jgi:hypothetical protein